MRARMHIFYYEGMRAYYGELRAARSHALIGSHCNFASSKPGNERIFETKRHKSRIDFSKDNDGLE
jgi:hypothetical protein